MQIWPYIQALYCLFVYFFLIPSRVEEGQTLYRILKSHWIEKKIEKMDNAKKFLRLLRCKRSDLNQYLKKLPENVLRSLHTMIFLVRDAFSAPSKLGYLDVFLR